MKVLLVSENISFVAVIGRRRRSVWQRSRRLCFIASKMICAGTQQNAVRRRSCLQYAGQKSDKC